MSVVQRVPGVPARRILYLDGYTIPAEQAVPAGDAPSSDAVGYGITASTVIRKGLEAAGFDVVRPKIAVPSDTDGRVARLRWLLSSYDGVLDVLSTSPPDVVFTFHAFAAFPVEIRRMLLDLGLDVPLVGYTHGSHWDPTDTFRFQAYPGMELLDLANLHVLDRILLVSDYLRATLWRTMSAFNEPLARALYARCEVVGLPLDIERIDGCRTEQRSTPTTVVFNHAPVSSKNPELFVDVMHRLLPRYDLQVLFTRRFPPGQAGGAAVAALAARFPEQVVLGNDLPIPDYYRALWMAQLQVSTATHESLGMSTLEAMYTGTCCILPRLGSYPEITGQHPDVLYDLGERQLEERLTYFLEHPDRRRAVAAELQRAAARYEPAVVVSRIVDVVKAL
ncbi:MAG: glycosyltransferase [Actinomycetota bacterium]|nr:glycosyltransferase [Actinomycetota bacterium]